MRKNPRYIAVGVAAGLLGSGATALMLLGPGATSATGTTPTTVEPTDDTEAADDTEATDDEMIMLHEPGAWLRDQLQPLVDDGTLTAEQADAIVDELQDSAPRPPVLGMPDIVVVPGVPDGNWPDLPGGPHHGPWRGHFPLVDFEVIAEVIGIDMATLREELQGGATIAEIAEANGVDPQAVVDAIVADLTERATTLVHGTTDDDPVADTEDTATEETTDTTTADA